MKKVRGLILLVSIICGFMVGYSLHHWIHQERYPNIGKVAVVMHEHPYYLMEDVNEEVLYKTLVHYNFPEPAIITAQAILESGNFKSRLSREKNNLFGLYDSSKMEYFGFDSWISCVFAYRNYILYKYDGKQDYYEFLLSIGYASDSLYVDKLRVIEQKVIEKYDKSRKTLGS